MKSSPIQPFSHRLRSMAKEGPARYQRFLASDEFRERFNAVPPSLRRRAIQAIIDAEILCARRDPLPPPVKPKAYVDAGKPRWQDPVQQARLRAAYAKANAAFGDEQFR